MEQKDLKSSSIPRRRISCLLFLVLLAAEQTIAGSQRGRRRCPTWAKAAPTFLQFVPPRPKATPFLVFGSRIENAFHRTIRIFTLWTKRGKEKNPLNKQTKPPAVERFQEWWEKTTFRNINNICLLNIERSNGLNHMNVWCFYSLSPNQHQFFTKSGFCGILVRCWINQFYPTGGWFSETGAV